MTKQEEYEEQKMILIKSLDLTLSAVTNDIAASNDIETRYVSRQSQLKLIALLAKVENDQLLKPIKKDK